MEFLLLGGVNLGLIIEGGIGHTYNFELSDNNGNKHYYEIYASNFTVALERAKTKFAKLYGNCAIYVVKNITGFPITRNL